MNSRLRQVITAAAAAIGLGGLAGMVGAQCPGGYFPADFCTSARVLSGAQGTESYYMDVSGMTGSGETSGGVPVGHTVWFSMVPTVSGIVTFTTCHPSTTYDTIVDAWSGGDSGCEFMTLVQRDDDVGAPECANGCSAWGSRVSFSVAAGAQYRFRVGSYNNNAAGCALCLGITVTLCGADAAAPSLTLSSPPPQACVCPGTVQVHGTVNDPGSGIASYVLDAMPLSGTEWTLISRGLGNVTGLLGLWYTDTLAEGDYALRLTARDGCGNTHSIVRVVRVNAAIDSLQLRSPSAGAVLGGWVIADGTAWDSCAPGQMVVERLPGPVAFSSINPPWIINDPLGSWDSKTAPDGGYLVRLTATNACGRSITQTASITIDNTAPVAVITSPSGCQEFLSGVLPIRGTVADANLASWALQWTGGGSPVWNTIATGNTAVSNGLLGNFDARGRPWCQYAFRLLVSDRAVLDGNGALHHQAEYVIVVEIGCPADYNHSGVVSVQDIFDFLAGYFAGCP